ncbi:hypothetical protein QPK31_16720 [Massilia sp. YIM B02769]|uniref:hypothetical protein n=1 Tax=Massilia sp. YIM B02769 TaxID=3050129 RepID=UPI0025B6F78D|nr:hypothetical protein [Massilia sp. YIM B02769]MDN4059868.1 hypothetical protein [Massilia sp. YIM B02769]
MMCRSLLNPAKPLQRKAAVPRGNEFKTPAAGARLLRLAATQATALARRSC